MKGRRGVAPHFFSLLSLKRLRSLVSLYHTHIFVFSVAFVVVFIYAVFNNKIHHFKINERWQHDEEFALTIKYEGWHAAETGWKPNWNITQGSTLGKYIPTYWRAVSAKGNWEKDTSLAPFALTVRQWANERPPRVLPWAIFQLGLRPAFALNVNCCIISRIIILYGLHNSFACNINLLGVFSKFALTNACVLCLVLCFRCSTTLPAKKEPWHEWKWNCILYNNVEKTPLSVHIENQWNDKLYFIVCSSWRKVCVHNWINKRNKQKNWISEATWTIMLSSKVLLPMGIHLYGCIPIDTA